MPSLIFIFDDFACLVPSLMMPLLDKIRTQTRIHEFQAIVGEASMADRGNGREAFART